MRSKHLFLIIGCFLLTAVLNLNICYADAVDDAKSVIDGIVMFKMQESGASDITGWIEKDLAPNAGITAETYAYALAKEGGHDLSAYAAALNTFLAENVVRAASTRLKYALCLAATDPENGYITETVNEAVGAQGVMSLVYGLHLANNGYIGSSWTKEGILAEIIKLRHSDGGWSVMGEYSDVDVTAMVIQSFAGYEPYADVSGAIDSALVFLSGKQLENGGYAGFGSDNAESTAQVLLALSSLGIDCEKDERFIKNGKTIFDGIEQYRLSDGTYAHVVGGTSNATATMQVFSAMEAYVFMKAGKLPYYVCRGEEPVITGAPASTATPEPEPTKTPEEPATQAPTATEAPKNTDAPTATEAPKNTDAPTATEAPKNTDAPKATITPTATDAPKATEAPKTTDSPTATDAPGNNDSPASKTGAKGYKPYAYAVIGVLGVLACILLFAFKKRNYKNFLFVVILCVAAGLIVHFTNISSPGAYYNGNALKGKATIGTATITIRCDTIKDVADSEFVPKDGIILKVTEYGIYEGETVYDLLVQAVREANIHMENRRSAVGAHGAYYISGINHIYEYEYGELSGWMYHVNGVAPSVGCGEYILKPGDRVEWLYTREIGRDIE